MRIIWYTFELCILAQYTRKQTKRPGIPRCREKFSFFLAHEAMFTSFVVVHSNSTFYIVSMYETVTASHKTERLKEMQREKLPLRMRTSSYKRPFSYQFNMKCILLFCTAVIAVTVVVFVVGGWVL